MENMATFEWLAFLPHNVFYGIYKQGLTTAANQLKCDPWNNTICCYNEKPHLLCVSDCTEINFHLYPFKLQGSLLLFILFFLKLF